MNGYDNLKALVKRNAQPPCISLIIPLAHTIPERSQNVVLFHKLVDDVLTQVAQINSPQARESEARLKKIVTTLDIDHISSPAIAILVDGAGHEIIELTMTCTAYTNVGTIFALSEIVQSMQSIERYWVLLIGKKYARLFQYATQHLTEIVTPVQNDAGQPLQGFPLNNLPPEDKVKEAVGSGDRGSDYIDADIKRFFQLVNKELQKIMTSQEKLPVILCGTPEYSKLFKTTSYHKEIVAFDIPHNYSAHQNMNNHLMADIEKALQAHHAEKEQQLLATFDDALNHNRQACGMIRVWETVSVGRVQTLLLEPHLSDVGRVNPDNSVNLQVFPHKSDITINRIADLLIYEALRHDGTVHIIRWASLKSCKGIGAILRY